MLCYNFVKSHSPFCSRPFAHFSSTRCAPVSSTRHPATKPPERPRVSMKGSRRRGPAAGRGRMFFRRGNLQQSCPALPFRTRTRPPGARTDFSRFVHSPVTFPRYSPSPCTPQTGLSEPVLSPQEVAPAKRRPPLPSTHRSSSAISPRSLPVITKSQLFHNFVTTSLSSSSQTEHRRCRMTSGKQKGG